MAIHLPRPLQSGAISLLSIPLLLRVAIVVLLLAGLAIALLPLPFSALLVGASAVCLATIIRPWVGLVLLAIVAPFAGARPVVLAGATVDAADLLLALAISAWLAQAAARHRIEIPRAPLAGPLLIFLGAQALSLPHAPSYREALPEALKWVEVLALYWCLSAVLPARRVGWLLAGLLMAGLGEALLGLYQFLTASGPQQFVLLGRFLRAYGTFRQPNPYAGYLGLIIPLALSLAIWWWTGRDTSICKTAQMGKSRPSPWMGGLLVLTTLILSLSLLLSWSRGGWLAAAFAFGVVVLAWSRRKAPLIVLAGGLLLFLMAVVGLFDLLPTSLVARLADLRSYWVTVDLNRVEVTDANFSVVERLAHWQAAIGMWADHPWLGVGLGNYAVVYPAYRVSRWQDPLGHAHNVYLNFGAETGLIGLAAYLLFWGAAIWHALQAARQRDRLVAAVGIAALGALAHATVHNLFDNLWVQHIYLNLALLLGAVTVLTAQAPLASEDSLT